MSFLPRLFLMVFMLGCLTGGAWADGAPPPLPASLQTVAYPDDSGSYTIRLGGWSAFAASKPSYNLSSPTLRLVDERKIQPCDTTTPGQCFQISVDDDVLTITLRDFSSSNAAPTLIFHATNDAAPDLALPMKVTLSAWSPNAPRIAAALLTIGLLALIGWLIGTRATVVLTTRQRVNPLRALLINKATSSYSLSSLQLYIWMIAAISTYIYLLLAHFMVQGDWSFVSVPPSVVGVALISVSTSVLSTGVNSANGGGGSGKFGPAFTDLISSGGDIAPERVQQLLWTLLGAPIFVILAYHTDPASISSIQDVPPEFLQLMGVSSAGYIGGKVARGAGPKITGLNAAFDNGPPPFLTLIVTGSDIQTKGATYYLTNLANPNSVPVAVPPTLGPTSKVDSSGVATEIDLTIPLPLIAPPPTGSRWNMQFTIHAADGEMAEWEF